MSDDLNIYKIFLFRGGRQICWGGCFKTNKEALEWAKMRENDLLGDGRLPFVETTIIAIANPPSFRGIRQHRATHTLAHLERKQPDVVFVSVIEDGAFRWAGKAADIASDEREKEIEQQIKDSSVNHAKQVKWDDLPERWKTRIRRKKKGCWIWPTNGEQAPYKTVYLRMKGDLPKGAHLLHSCDNPHCVNPNHLTPGTHRQNNQDMLDRKRHWRLKYK